MSQPTDITYTKEEQVELNRLGANARVLGNIRALLAQGQYPGSAAAAVIQSTNFVNALLQQTERQIAAVEETASKRASAPEQGDSDAGNSQTKAN